MEQHFYCEVFDACIKWLKSHAEWFDLKLNATFLPNGLTKSDEFTVAAVGTRRLNS